MKNVSNKNEPKNANCNAVIVAPTAEALPVVFDFLLQNSKEHSLEERASDKLQVVADEIFSNIVKYSGATSAQVAFCAQSSVVTLVFEDDGAAFDPTKTLQQNTSLADRHKEGGRGIFTVMRLADNIGYTRRDNKNILTISIKIKE